jgi:methylated-DNA-[protein]-cysteine S-methyltransferase
MNTELYQTFYHSPLGTIEIAGTTEAVTDVKFVENKTSYAATPVPPVLLDCTQQLQEYFAGQRKVFSVKMAAQGTPFQQSVWDYVAKIPYGKTVSYKTIALLLGDAGASRAVGMANGKNPLLLLVPCHRVISQDGSLTGYAGGLWRKQWLLDKENEEQLRLF